MRPKDIILLLEQAPQGKKMRPKDFILHFHKPNGSSLKE